MFLPPYNKHNALFTEVCFAQYRQEKKGFLAFGKPSEKGNKMSLFSWVLIINMDGILKQNQI